MAQLALDDLLDVAVTNARTAWPSIIFDAGEFRQCLRARIGEGADETEAASTLAALCLDDFYLAQACGRADPQALAAFDARFLAQVPTFLARHRARGAADEIRQVLRERLLMPQGGGPPRISEYTGRGPLSNWLRVVTLRAASNLIRRDKPQVPIDEGVLAAISEVPEIRILEGRYRSAFREAFRDAFAALETTERTALKLHFQGGVTVRTLAPILGVSPATAARRILAAQVRLGELILERLGEKVQATPSELHSVVRALISRLDVSMTTLLPSG